MLPYMENRGALLCYIYTEKALNLRAKIRKRVEETNEMNALSLVCAMILHLYEC